MSTKIEYINLIIAANSNSFQGLKGSVKRLKQICNFCNHRPTFLTLSFAFILFPYLHPEENYHLATTHLVL